MLLYYRKTQAGSSSPPPRQAGCRNMNDTIPMTPALTVVADLSRCVFLLRYDAANLCLIASLRLWQNSRSISTASVPLWLIPVVFSVNLRHLYTWLCRGDKKQESLHNTDDILDTDSFRPRAVNEDCHISWIDISYRSDRVRAESGEPVCGLMSSSVYHSLSPRQIPIAFFSHPML